MAIIAPFKGLTYNLERLDDISNLIAPPYDVISEEEQEGYYQADPYNVIRLILGKKKTGDTDWDNRYTRSADVYKRWESEEILVRTGTPAIYVTSLTYDLGDDRGPKVRWGLIVLVRIEDEDSGVILPHERTFSAHRDDRLKLMRACNAQLSQVFGLYEDSDNRVFAPLKKAIEAPPRISFPFRDGTSHQLWAIRDRSILRKVADAMSEKSIIIADGHHRYETSRNFRNMMRARYGTRPPNRAYEYVMMYLTNMNDVGMTILPSHRLIKRCEPFQLESFLDNLKQWFEISALPSSKPDPLSQSLGLKRMLEEKGRSTSAIGFYCHGDPKCYLFSLKEGVRDEMGEDLHAALKKLDVLVLSRFIFQKSLGFSKEDLDNEEIFHYKSDMVEALSLVDSGTYQMAFFLNPTKMEHVKEVTGNALIMPRKSTYFYPKVLTGLVFNKIDPYEIIEVP
ncbi:MAG: DUF1015 domain-containing protein [Deltaproteobacteria bacterium]|nr:MAG: DUF1015 domain-containing protein [Deltaproteobacteria bacterium]